MGSFIIEVLLIAAVVSVVAAVTQKPPRPCKWHTWKRTKNNNFHCEVCGKTV